MLDPELTQELDRRFNGLTDQLLAFGRLMDAHFDYLEARFALNRSRASMLAQDAALRKAIDDARARLWPTEQPPQSP